MAFILQEKMMALSVEFATSSVKKIMVSFGLFYFQSTFSAKLLTL